MTDHEEHVAAMMDAQIQAIWLGTPNRESMIGDQTHYAAIADRAEELGYTRTADTWRAVYHQRTAKV